MTRSSRYVERMDAVPYDLALTLAVTVDDPVRLQSQKVQTSPFSVEIWPMTDTGLIVQAVAQAMNSTMFRRELARYGLSVANGQVRELTDNSRSLLPGAGHDVDWPEEP